MVTKKSCIKNPFKISFKNPKFISQKPKNILYHFLQMMQKVWHILEQNLCHLYRQTGHQHPLKKNFVERLKSRSKGSSFPWEKLNRQRLQEVGQTTTAYLYIKFCELMQIYSSCCTVKIHVRSRNTRKANPLMLLQHRQESSEFQPKALLSLSTVKLVLDQSDQSWHQKGSWFFQCDFFLESPCFVRLGCNT